MYIITVHWSFQQQWAHRHDSHILHIYIPTLIKHRRVFNPLVFNRANKTWFIYLPRSAVRLTSNLPFQLWFLPIPRFITLRFWIDSRRLATQTRFSVYVLIFSQPPHPSIHLGDRPPAYRFHFYPPTQTITSYQVLTVDFNSKYDRPITQWVTAQPAHLRN